VQESVNSCVLAGFLSARLVAPPSPPYLVHLRYRQCLQGFCDTFHALACDDFLCRQFPKRLAQGDLPGARQLPQTASLFVERDRGTLQILGLELTSVNILYRNQSLRYASEVSFAARTPLLSRFQRLFQSEP
jgi:hypothetical protein